MKFFKEFFRNFLLWNGCSDCEIISPDCSLGDLFSSPEHEVLMVSYCDRAVSVVRRPSSTFYLVYALEATVLVGYS